MDDYKVTILESTRDLTARERIMLKDITNATKLDEATNEAPLRISPCDYVVLSIHNEKSDNKDYENYVILDSNGTKYVTGSTSFWNAFKEIWLEMKGESEPYEIEIYKVDSKNYKGKQFLTCSIV